jgi:hypothetical protein
MAAPKRTAFQREADLERISEMYLKGKTQQEIADATGVRQQQITYDLKTIRQRWIASSVRNFDEERGIALAKIDALERAAWDAWEKSCEEKTRKSIQQNAFGDKTSSVTTETLLGNPAYLQIVDRCIERRCKLLGLDAPVRTEVTGKDGGRIKLDSVVMDDSERSRKILEILDKARERGT